MFTNFSNMKGPCLEVGVCVYKLIVRSVWGNVVSYSNCFTFERAVNYHNHIKVLVFRLLNVQNYLILKKLRVISVL